MKLTTSGPTSFDKSKKPTEQRPGLRQAALATGRERLARDIDRFIQGWTAALGDSSIDRAHAAKCIEAALVGRHEFDGKDGVPGVLDFGSYNPACMKLPVELINSLDDTATLQNNPVETVVLPPGLTELPPWLGQLTNLKRLEAPEFAGSVGELHETLPDVDVITDMPSPAEPGPLRRTQQFEAQQPRAHSTLAEVVKKKLAQYLSDFVDKGNTAPCTSLLDRQHAARCIEAAVVKRHDLDGKDGEPGTLDFGSYNPACMDLPDNLIGALNTATDMQKNPVETVILPPGLSEIPSWLRLLPHLQRLEIPDFAGDILDLRGLPDSTWVDVQRLPDPDGLLAVLVSSESLRIEGIPQRVPQDIERT